jgi:hypothetical protein
MFDNQKKASRRPETVDHRMESYAAAALAAGVSMLALAYPANAEVVITHKNIPIPLTNIFGGSDNGPQPVPLDLNNDGIADFSFSLVSFIYHSFYTKLTIKELTGGEAVGVKGHYRAYVSALAHGAKIGPSAHFSETQFGYGTLERSDGSINQTQPASFFGKWRDKKNRYVGVKFPIDGKTHYGWVRMTVNQGPWNATITEYGYETVANKRLDAGESGADAEATQTQAVEAVSPSLGVLALGADGLGSWRSNQAPGH